jgi:hypothetical protein
MVKRILAFIVIALVSYGTMICGKLGEHPVLLYIGMIIGGALALGFIVWLMKLMARFMGWAMTSALYLASAITIMGLLAWYEVIPTFAGVMASFGLSILLVVMIIRKLANWAQKSVVGSEVFSWVSGYEIKNIIQKDKILDKDTVIELNAEIKNLIAVLRGLQYNKTDAKEAAIYVVQQYPQEPMDSKIIRAVQYLSPDVSGRKN